MKGVFDQLGLVLSVFYGFVTKNILTTLQYYIILFPRELAATRQRLADTFQKV